MTTERITAHGQAFTTLHGVLTHGSDPSRGESGNPVKHISTVTSQVLHHQGHRDIQGLRAGAYTPQTASFEVVDNDFSTGVATLLLGDYEIKSNLDYLPGVDAAATAAVIATAIGRIPEFTASALLAVVSITREPPMDRVEFRVLFQGTVVNFTSVTPENGWMEQGAPTVSPPTIT